MHQFIDDYFKALYSATKWELKSFDSKIETIFIGGGTPSVANAIYYEKIFKLLDRYLSANCEITIEANPNSASKEWLYEIYNLGVNRVSFGVQSFNDKKLIALNRAHNSSEAISAVENAYNIGFKNISIDIIYDTYIDSYKLLKDDIDIAFKLPINHISTYELIEENLPWFKGNVKLNNEKFNFFIRDLIVDRGFEQYEVSNFGRYRCKHNMAYWKHKEYIGIGAGAVGFRKNYRYYPKSGIKAYINDPFSNRKEYLSSEDILTEKIMLGLRSCVGVDLKILPKNMQDRVFILQQEDKIFIEDGVIYAKELFLADEISLFIMQN